MTDPLDTLKIVVSRVGTKAQVIAESGGTLEPGRFAWATDTSELGFYDGSTWHWVAGTGLIPSFATPAIVLGTAAAAGVATTVIRSDATIVAFDATVPAAIGTAATGSVAKAARRDHVHATGAGTPTTQAFGDAAATGSGPAAAMTDHKHAMPAAAVTSSGLTESTATILGRTTVGTGAIEEITVGSGLTLSAGSLAASGSSSGSDHEHIMNLWFSGDGSTTAFELPAAPFDSQSVRVWVSGTLTDVTLSGTLLTTMTFGSAPASATNNIVVDLVAAAA